MTDRRYHNLVDKALAERDEVFLELLPTLTRAELAHLVKTKPQRWQRYARYLDNPLPSEVPR